MNTYAQPTADELIRETAIAVVRDMAEHPMISLREAVAWQLAQHRDEWAPVIAAYPWVWLASALNVALQQHGRAS